MHSVRWIVGLKYFRFTPSAPAIWKNSGKYGLGLSCRWPLFATWAFGFKLHLIFNRVGFKKPVEYYIWQILMVGIGAFRVLMRIRLNIETYSLLKPAKVGLIFIGSNSFRWTEDLAAVNHLTQAVVIVGLKIGFLSRV